MFRCPSPFDRCRALALLLGLCAAPAHAGTATVAVAANFATTLEKLGERFAREGEHDIRIVTGSTGKLYTQIIHGAPFDIFLAADAERPARLVSEGRAAGGDRLTYATGRLVLWSRTEEVSEETPGGGKIDRLAIANPELAPYGAAAMEVLAHYGLVGEAQPALVMGENSAQAIAMLATGNVDFGLVPLSIRANDRMTEGGHLWLVPREAHAPIRQDGVLLERGRDNPAAVAFFAFLSSEAARALVVADGYDESEP